MSHRHDNWNKTIFSDEITFQMYRNTLQVRYHQGRSRPYKVMVKHPYKVHLWAAFSSTGPIDFHLFTNNMNAQVYCDILSLQLIPNTQSLGTCWRFQQDNAPTHTARITQ